MNVEITNRHIHVTDEVAEYARDKAERVTKFLKQDVRVDVVVDKEHDDFLVEVIVSGHKGNVVVGRERHAEPRAAIDLVMDKVSQQLRKLAGRRKHHQGESMAGEETVAPDESLDEAELTYEDIIDEELNK